MNNSAKSSHPIITLSTDFGLEDPYVGVMKGVILGINPKAPLVDLTHDLSNHRLLEAAFVLNSAYPYFPRDTIHLVVVDPGVGGKRRSMAIQAQDGSWIGPDNGIFSLIIKKYPQAKLFHLTNPDFFLKNVSSTFHGRDVFAPVAAHLSLGISLREMGEPFSDPEVLEIPEPQVTKNRIVGQVLWVDHFGNLITNIDQKLIPVLKNNQAIHIFIGAHEISGLLPTYSQAPPQSLLALIGSMGHLEIAGNLSRASDLVGYQSGEVLKVEVVFDPGI